MPGSTPIYGFPYPLSTDLVANYPALGQQLAEDVETALGNASKILQVVNVIKQDTFTTNSTTYVDVTGLSASITPSSATHKVLVIVSLALGQSVLQGYHSRGQILRNSTVIGAGTAAGSRVAGSFAYTTIGGVSSPNQSVYTQNLTFLDSPSTTSATTYKVQIATETGGTATVGYGNATDQNQTYVIRNASAITLMEVTP